MSEVEATSPRGRQGRGRVGRSAPNRGVGAPVVVTLVEAPACHLCEDAKSALATLARSFPMTVHVVSIDEGTQRWYGEYPSMWLSDADLLTQVRSHLAS